MKFIKFFGIIIIIMALGSCTKWLKVQPEDQFSEEQIYTTPQGIADAMNGLYVAMGKSSLYGKDLSMKYLDILAQRYVISSNNSTYTSWKNFDYTNSSVKSTLDNIWTQMYVTIANTNQFLLNIDKYGSILDESLRMSYKAEALGIRAYLYFDLLRMWGPVYNTKDSILPAIPYKTVLNADVSPYMPANQVLDSIMKDVNLSLDYFREIGNDQTFTTGTTYANNIMNYYAVLAFKARALLWRGDKIGAAACANEVIANTSKYPWVSINDIANNKENPDRTFSSEVLFSVFNQSLYSDSYNTLFAPTLDDDNILSTGSASLVNSTYDNNGEDYRWVYTWYTPTTGKAYQTFFKYADVVSSKMTFRYLVPLIRKSEVYYIAAECSSDPLNALAYLNTVRRARGISVDLPSSSILSEQIRKEYQKEFWGEGQLWFYYKRLGLTSLPALNPSTTTTVSVEVSDYIFPIPDSETSVR